MRWIRVLALPSTFSAVLRCAARHGLMLIIFIPRSHFLGLRAAVNVSLIFPAWGNSVMRSFSP